MIPPLEETFAGVSMRVVDMSFEIRNGTRSARDRFAVLAKSPTTFGAEVELCAVQYLPHAVAIAALPELATALKGLVPEAFRNMRGGAGHLIDQGSLAIEKAEGKNFTIGDLSK